MELLELQLGLLQRAPHLRELGLAEDGLAVFLPRPVKALAELRDQDLAAVDFSVVPGSVGKDLGQAQPGCLAVKEVRGTPKPPHLSLRSKVEEPNHKKQIPRGPGGAVPVGFEF